MSGRGSKVFALGLWSSCSKPLPRGKPTAAYVAKLLALLFHHGDGAVVIA